MTIEPSRHWTRPLLLLLVTGAIATSANSCAGSHLRHGDSLNVSGYPRDVQSAYDVFATRCSRCHTLARPLNARIKDPQHWVRYVTRMRRNPTSGINTKDAEIILRFLLYYMQQKNAAEREPEEGNTTPPVSAGALDAAAGGTATPSSTSAATMPAVSSAAAETAAPPTPIEPAAETAVPEMNP